MKNLALKQVNRNVKQQLNTKLNVKVHSHAIQCYFQNDDHLLTNFKLPQIKYFKNLQTKVTCFRDKMLFQKQEYVKMIYMTKLNNNHPIELGTIHIHPNKDKRISKAKVSKKFAFISFKKGIDLESNIVVSQIHN